MSCIACGSARLTLPRGTPAGRRESAERFGSSRVDAPRPELARCRACGLAFRYPMPDAAQVREIYEALDDELYLEEEGNRRRAARRALALVERYANPDSGPLLDVGCSSGLFLEEAERRGWSVRGVEPSQSLSERARRRLGDRVETASFEGYGGAGAPFAAITLWDVLEHVTDPRAFLSKASSLLAPGGVIVVNVPRRDSPMARLLGRRWPLLLPEHLYYFTPRSLRRLSERAGLRTVAFHPHPVFFSLGYVLHRLAQHGFPGTRGAARRLRGTRTATLSLPLLMGEVTAVCRAA